MRIFEPLNFDALREIRDCSLREVDRFVTQAGSPPGKFRCYEAKLVAICLCQGAAQHFIDAQDAPHFDNTEFVPETEIGEKGYQVLPNGRVISGVNDIDVCIFFQHDDAVPIPNRRHCMKSIKALFSGLGHRRVDFLKKGIPAWVIEDAKGSGASEIVRSYVRNTPHGQGHLGRKSVVGLYPDRIFGNVLWRTLRLIPDGVNENAL